MRRQTTLPRSLHVSERAPQWERDNGLLGRHALSSPVPPRSCHRSLIAQNGLLRDCCPSLLRSLPYPAPEAGVPTALSAPHGAGEARAALGTDPRPFLHPWRPELPWAPSPRLFLRPRSGPSQAFPRRMRGRESGRPPGPGCSRPHLHQRGALPPCSGLGQPAGFVSFRVWPRAAFL